MCTNDNDDDGDDDDDDDGNIAHSVLWLKSWMCAVCIVVVSGWHFDGFGVASKLSVESIGWAADNLKQF